jgi:hypothetical protein
MMQILLYLRFRSEDSEPHDRSGFQSITDGHGPKNLPKSPFITAQSESVISLEERIRRTESEPCWCCGVVGAARLLPPVVGEKSERQCEFVLEE